MQVTSINVTTDAGVIEEHKKAVGHSIENGALVIIETVLTLDEEGKPARGLVPRTIYAPGTWRKLEVEGVRGDEGIVPVGAHTLRKLNSKKLN